MRANLKTVFVIDVEATCWSTKEEQGSKPNEIIEIGVAVLDINSGAVVDGGSIVVRPRYTKISAFCEELTGWTQAEIDNGLDIVDAFEEFKRAFKPEHGDVWFSCGDYDRMKLSSNTNGGVGRLYSISSDFNPFDNMRAHINIKMLFAMKKKLSKEVGMEKMLNIIGEKIDGRHHNGADDAKNIAKIVHWTLT